MLRMLHVFGLSLSLFLASACQTTEKNEKPEIVKDMDLGEAYAIARSHDVETLGKVKEVFRERKANAEMAKLAEQDLVSNNLKLNFTELTNVANMYMTAQARPSPRTVKALLISKEPMVRKIGWRMAAARPAVEIASVIDGVLNNALSQGREDEMLDPDMARALQENNMKSAYTFLSRGLQVQGAPEYASAMLALNPREATPAFLTYLMRADLEDLRQLNQKSVNVYTCTVIFRFLIENPLPISHPGVASIFLFAVSRNRGLADMANAVLEKQIPEHRESFAILLARLPVPVQVAFIENSQREMTANLRLLLQDLKEVAQNKEVIEELNSPNESGAQ
ncbi:MAG: hypothetical protein V4655_06620 [Bdellovibrionota bacterium]